MASYIALRRALYHRQMRTARKSPIKLGAWSIHRDRDEYSLYHYGTCMCRWRDNADGSVHIMYTSLGWGSVSDQGGMNALFQTLEVPLRYDRAGGAQISALDSPACAPYYRDRLTACWR